MKKWTKGNKGKPTKYFDKKSVEQGRAKMDLQELQEGISKLNPTLEYEQMKSLAESFGVGVSDIRIALENITGGEDELKKFLQQAKEAAGIKDNEDKQVVVAAVETRKAAEALRKSLEDLPKIRPILIVMARDIKASDKVMERIVECIRCYLQNREEKIMAYASASLRGPYMWFDSYCQEKQPNFLPMLLVDGSLVKCAAKFHEHCQIYTENDKINRSLDQFVFIVRSYRHDMEHEKNVILDRINGPESSYLDGSWKTVPRTIYVDSQGVVTTYTEHG